MDSVWNEKTAVALLSLAERRTRDPFKAALHLAACLASLAPTRKDAHRLIDAVFDQADRAARVAR